MPLVTTNTRVLELVKEHLGLPTALPESKLREDLGADSLDTVELFMAIEEEFNVEIPDEVADKLRTIADISAFIDQYWRNR